MTATRATAFMTATAADAEQLRDLQAAVAKRPLRCNNLPRGSNAAYDQLMSLGPATLCADFWKGVRDWKLQGEWRESGALRAALAAACAAGRLSLHAHCSAGAVKRPQCALGLARAGLLRQASRGKVIICPSNNAMRERFIFQVLRRAGGGAACTAAARRLMSPPSCAVRVDPCSHGIPIWLGCLLRCSLPQAEARSLVHTHRRYPAIAHTARHRHPRVPAYPCRASTSRPTRSLSMPSSPSVTLCGSTWRCPG